MRPHFIKTSIALLMCAPFAASGGLAADWNGSYAADGQCFCTGAVAAAVENSIVPTPVGGQTVAQVCQRIGAGPGLKLKDDLYNYPVYSDSQCGHGPFEAARSAIQTNCAGSLDGKGAESTTCRPVGPRWDINQTNTKKKDEDVKVPAEKEADVSAAVIKQSNTEDKSQPTSSLLNKPVVTSISVNRASEGDGETRTLKATVISSASTAGRALPKREALEPFTGKIISIDGKRYMQAREDLPAKGGQPGSRIILDGSIYLLDDGTINPTDLRRGKPVEVKKPKKTSGKSVKPKKQKLASKGQNESNDTIKNLRGIEPVRDEQNIIADRNSVPRALPKSIESNKVAILPDAKPAPVKKFVEIRKADLLPALATTIVAPDEVEALAIQTTDASNQNEVTIPAQIATVIEELNGSRKNDGTQQVGLISALKLPATAHSDVERFSYVEAIPVSYDVGGAGLVVKGSSESHSKFHYVGRIGVTSSYQELMLGGGYYLTPRSAERLTMVVQAGVEYGSFRLEDDQNTDITVNYNDTGLYFGAATRLVLNHRFELRGGLGYSTFFQGDLLMFGGAYWHLTRRLDLVSQFELGDNDLIGLGIRFYY